MNKEPTQEQIREFWEWCGWKIVKDIELWLSIRPDGSTYMSTVDEKCIPLLFEPLDLNNLFQYAVPKVYEYDIVLVCKGEREYEASIWESPNGKQVTYAESSDPALALFWALWQVMDKK